MIRSFFLVTLCVILTLSSVQSGPPIFDSTFETKEINEGSRASVLCRATNDSPIKYKWYNKQFGEEVSDKANSDVKTSEVLGGSRLIFDPVSSSHEGVYTCTAENQHGLVSKVYQIVVNSGNITENDTLSVSVLNVTDSSVEFFIESSNPMQSYVKVEYFEKIKTNKTIFELEGSNAVFRGLIPSGLYTFRFQAIFSDNRTSGWSQYEVVLLPYTPEVVMRSFSGNTLQIEWSKKLDDFRRETIDGYSVSYGILQRENYDTWKPLNCLINIEIPSSCYGTKYTIADLSKSSYYEIRLRAHTKAGYGKPFVTKVFVA